MLACFALMLCLLCATVPAILKRQKEADGRLAAAEKERLEDRIKVLTRDMNRYARALEHAVASSRRT